MDLILVRHAIAFERDPARWPDDRERPLTRNGEERFRKAARGLERLFPSVDVVLSSPLTRAWQTAQILKEEAAWPAPVECEELEPDRKPAEMFDILRSRSNGPVALVGHEPHLGELISLLLTGADDGAAFELRKGGVARLELEKPMPGEGVLRWLMPPKILRAIRG